MLRQSERFAKQSRLNNPSDFKRAFRSKDRSVDRYFVVIANKNSLDHARLGMAISRKWVKKAVDRNRIKRLIRESFRRDQEMLTGLDIVVMTNKNPGRPTNKEISESLQGHWQKLCKCKQ